MSRIFAAATIASLGVMTIAISGSSVSTSSAEVQRIQSHFDSVLTELGARDVSALTSSQRSERAALVATLRAYRDRGVFPHNYDFPGTAVPYFVDRKTGTLCAVAHLLESTGRRDIVDRVSAMNNNVRVPDLATDTALAGWLEAHGLTLSEAARIQVPYVGPPQPVQVQQPTIRRSNAAGRAAVGAASLATFYFSTRGYLRHRQMVAMKREAAKPRLSASPVVSPTDGVGLSFTFRF